MISYNNQCAFKLDELDERLKGKQGGEQDGLDPLLDMKYVSSVNQGRFETIGQLETGVSLIQAAQKGIEKITFWLQEIGHFLNDMDDGKGSTVIPKSVINKYIGDRLVMIEDAVNNASFQNRKLLNGDCGIRAEVNGESLKFIRGSARVASSGEPGYAVAIYQVPRPSMYTGVSPLTQEEIDREQSIGIDDGTLKLRYRLKKGETPESLVVNLKKILLDQNLDVDVFRTRDNRLFFRHNQLGSKNNFKVMSESTSLVSKNPGEFESSIPGIDIAGTIDSESAHGDGGFLIGDRNNKHTDGLVLFYDGDIEYPGQIVGYVRLSQNGITVPIDPAGTNVEMLSIPSVDPKYLAVGLTTMSGFSDLTSIEIVNEASRKDALKMTLWSVVYLDYLNKELKLKENDYTDRTIQLLRGSMSTSPAECKENLCLSSEKAGEMVEQIKKMLG